MHINYTLAMTWRIWENTVKIMKYIIVYLRWDYHIVNIIRFKNNRFNTFIIKLCQSVSFQSKHRTPKCIHELNSVTREKGKDLTQSYDESPYTKRKNQKINVTTQKTPTKTSFTQRLRTDSGRSVGSNNSHLLVWLTTLRALNLPTNRNNRVIKRDTYLKL